MIEGEITPVTSCSLPFGKQAAIRSWGELDFWRSGECQVIEERLDDLDKAYIAYCPKRTQLYAAMDKTEFKDVKVAIIGQDPYPTPKHATGVAFSIPSSIMAQDFPPTLKNLFKEYSDDLHLPRPTTGCLDKWTEQGVFLWNAIPTCLALESKSHGTWPEWPILTQEIVIKLGQRGIVIVLLGTIARSYARFATGSIVLQYPHPAARMRQFSGCRMFSTINAKLVQQNLPIIEWKLP